MNEKMEYPEWEAHEANQCKPPTCIYCMRKQAEGIKSAKVYPRLSDLRNKKKGKP